MTPKIYFRLSRRVSSWVLLGMLLTLALSVPSLGIQAQDGGRGRVLNVQLTLNVDTAGLHLDRVCLGQTIKLPLSVQATIEVQGNATAGHVQVRAATIAVAAQNPSLVSAHIVVAPPGLPPDDSFSAHLELKGLAAGSTTVEITATLRSNIVLSFVRGADMPVETTSEVTPARVPVRVVPCKYLVSSFSYWHTQLFGASILVSVTIDSVHLASSTGGRFSPVTPGFFALTATTNRIPTCDVTTNLFDRQPLDISGEIVDDEFIVRVGYPVPGGERNELGCQDASRTASEYRRSGESRISLQQEFQNFEPATLDDIVVPLDGGTVIRPLRLNFKNGTAEGTTVIRITAVTSP